MSTTKPVTITYMIPVVVTVDVEAGEVTRVDEYREELGSCWPDVRSETGDQVPAQVEERALEIAETTTWPVWELV
jgi:hypothetical protein